MIYKYDLTSKIFKWIIILKLNWFEMGGCCGSNDHYGGVDYDTLLKD